MFAEVEVSNIRILPIERGQDASQEEGQGRGGDGQAHQDSHRVHGQVQAQEMQTRVQEVLSGGQNGKTVH